MNSHVRVDISASAAYRAMLSVEKVLSQCSIESSLQGLIKLRVSQINGCAYCIDMHWEDARAAGETEQRLYGLSAWRESPYYSERERAGLLMAEELTRVADRSLPDEVYEYAHDNFNDQELGDLSWTVAAINAWNRVNIGLRTVPGEYQAVGATH